MTISVTATIKAAPDEVYALVADLPRMGEWSPETRSVHWLDGATQARPGVRFRGLNRQGPWSWQTTCTIEKAIPGQELSFRSNARGLAIAHWRYTFEPDGSGGTLVTESTTDERGRLLRSLSRVATGVGDRGEHNRTTMRETLEQLKRAAEGSHPDAPR